jgi:Mg2+ and Co2+ transporter CorA
MAKIKIEPIKVEIVISAKQVKQFASDRANNLFEEFEDGILKKLGYKNQQALADVIAQDPKFLDAIVKGAKIIYEDNDDYLYDLVYDSDVPFLTKLWNEAEKLQDSINEEIHENRKLREEAEQIKRSVKVLELAGFKITPPKMVDN